MSHLPIHAFRTDITDALRRGNNLVVTAPTGSGKSTQIPQMLLDSGFFNGRILILQPRRLAARMLAARVAQERGSELGGEIGFQTRFETLVSDGTRACFITEGILPRMLLTHRTLEGISAIVFDEFHERNLATDVGLAIAVDLVKTVRPDLRLIVMSATIEAAPVAAFLGNARVIDCPGRMHPIAIRYTPAPKNVAVWDLAAQAVRSLVAQGAPGDILVFMPGAYEIRRSVAAIDGAVRGEPTKVIPLYGDLPVKKQQEVMEPLSCRKIIVATNIAETSLTIPGVRHVVDSGLARVNRFDAARGFNTLFVEPISRASADQRAGRAGREDAGICIRLWSAAQHSGRAHVSTPEITRVDLAETVLQLYALGYAGRETVPWFEPPDPSALCGAHELLHLLGAVSPGGDLTDKGRGLCRFPMHPRLACLLVEAEKRGAVELAAFAAALLSERSALAGKPDYPEDAFNQDALSDLFGHYCLLEKVRKSGYDPALCTRYAVNASAARAIFRTQELFLRYCRRAGMPMHDSGSAPVNLCRCMLAAYPDHLCRRKDAGTLICSMRDNRHGELDRRSIVRKARLFVAADIRETKTPRTELKTILSLASEVLEEWLVEDFTDRWSTRSTLEWNPANGSVEAHTADICLGVVISEAVETPVDPDGAATVLAETILSKKLAIETWDRTTEEWLGRVRWAARHFTEKQLPAFSGDVYREAVLRLCEGERRYDAVRRKPVLPVLKGMLSAEQRGFIDRMAPEFLTLPSGRKARIVYDTESPPRIRAKIQDLYGLHESPRIAAGTVGVLIEILAPNNRPVQITDDPGRFWEVHYPGLKKTLSRRYPRHEWR